MNDLEQIDEADAELLVGRVADEFTDRLNRGECPEVEEYAKRHPHIAEILRQVLASLQTLRSGGTGSPAQAEAAFDKTPVPERLGDYRILREIGRGGMGVVYEAVQEALSRHVALKVLPPQAVANPTVLARFRREAHAAARLHHTNIVPVFGVGQQDGVHYYAMQYIAGQSLEKVLEEVRRQRTAPADTPTSPTDLGARQTRSLDSRVEAVPVQPLTEPNQSGSDCTARSGSGFLKSTSADSDANYYRSVARIGAQVADALAYAHGQGVVHRDIKPSNLLLDGRDTVWVMDFGLAKEAGDDLTQTGDIVGTLRFMAPERFSGETTPQSDVYGLGVTLYELLTLRPAFDARDRSQLIKQVTHEEPTAPRQIDRRIPSDLETIVLKANAKEPTLRYESASRLADDLRRFLDDKPIEARRATATERAWRWCRRNPVVAGLTTSVAVLLVVIAIGSSSSALWLHRERNATLDNLNRALTAESDARQLATETKELADDARKAERLAESRLYQSLVTQARAGRKTGEAGQRFKSLEALADAARMLPALGLGPDAVLELRNEAVACMALADVWPRNEWEGLVPGGHQSAIFDPAMEHYARSDFEGNISLRRVADDTEVAHLPGPGYNGSGMFSPDGAFLAIGYTSSLPGQPPKNLVWNWRSGAIFQPPVSVLSWSFSPDSRILAVGNRDRQEVVLYELATEKETGRFVCGSDPRRLAFHPDGTKLAIAGTDAELRDVASGNLIRKLPHPAGPYDLAWHPDGVLLATACQADVYLWETDSGQQRAVLKGHQGTVSRVSFCQGGDVLVSSSWDGSSRLWDTWSRRQLLLSAAVAFPYDSKWDSRGLFSSSGTKLRLWDVALGREYRTLSSATDSGAGINGGSISADSRWLAVAANDGVRLWDLTNEREAAFLRVGRTTGVVFHPQGDELFACGPAGVFRWPFQNDCGVLRIGPPRRLPVQGTANSMAIDRGASRLAVVGGGGLVLDLQDPSTQAVRLDHPVAGQIAMSPNGDWIATATWNGYGVRVWDAHSGSLARELIPEARHTHAQFSPDGRWLVTSSETGFQFWEVDSWELRRRIDADGNGHGIAFARDGRVMAICPTRTLVQLLDVATGRPLANLTAPFPDNLRLLGFSGDGSRLFVSSGTPPRIRIWDLRTIREQLAEFGLDWELESYAPAGWGESIEPLVAQVDLGEFAAPVQAKSTTPSERDRQELETHDRNVESNPASGKAYYDRSVFYARLNDRAKADADMGRALELYDRDIESNPKDPTPYHNRGHIHFRFGEFQKAADDFTEALRGQPDDPHLLRERAAAYSRLGQLERAAGDWSGLIELNPKDTEALYQRAGARTNAKEFAGAVADYRMVLALKPDHAAAANNLAWLLATGPADLRDPATALALAEKAVELEPKNWLYLNTLGVTHFRLDHFQEAITQLERAGQANKDGPTAFENIFLAICHQKLGHSARAAECYEKALQWFQAPSQLPAGWTEELETFRAEADALLGKQP